MEEIEIKENVDLDFSKKTIKYLATKEHLEDIVGKTGSGFLNSLNERLNSNPLYQITPYEQSRIEAVRLKYFRTQDKKLKLKSKK